MRRALVVSAVIVIGAAVASSCGGSTPVASAAADLHRAAVATANAHSFMVRYLTGVDVTYQAPDRVQQVEHGEGSSSSLSSNGPPSTSGTFAETITKVFIGHSEYEASGPLGREAPFSVSARCPGDSNVAEYVLGILRAIAVSPRVSPEPGGGFAFTIPKGGAVPFPIRGVATITSGYVATIDVNPGSGNPPAITIGSVDASPPVTAPTSARASQVSCSSSQAGRVPAGPLRLSEAIGSVLTPPRLCPPGATASAAGVRGEHWDL